MARVANLVQETSATAGTGTLTLTAASGYARFSQRFGVGDLVHYLIENGANWEFGIGTVGASNTLVRSVVMETFVSAVLTTSGATPITLSGTSTVRCVGSAQALYGLRPRVNAIIGGNSDTNPWQRGTSFTAVANAAYTADRFYWTQAGAGVVTISRATASPPTVALAGKKVDSYFEIAPTTADASIAVGDVYRFTTRIEGYDFQELLAQRDMTLRFLHAHSKVGTYCASLLNSNGDRVYVGEYVQDVANAWEIAEIPVIASPSAGTWNYTTGTGVQVGFALAAGSTYQVAAGSWVTPGSPSTFISASAAQVNAMDNIANRFRIAQIELVTGKSTEWDDRSRDDEWYLCRRYHRRFSSDASSNHYLATGWAFGASTALIPMALAAGMRSLPTITHSAIGDLGILQGASGFPLTSISIGYSADSPLINCGTGGGLTVGQANTLYVAAGAGKHLSFTSEL